MRHNVRHPMRGGVEMLPALCGAFCGWERVGFRLWERLGTVSVTITSTATELSDSEIDSEEGGV